MWRACDGACAIVHRFCLCWPTRALPRGSRSAQPGDRGCLQRLEAEATPSRTPAGESGDSTLRGHSVLEPAVLAGSWLVLGLMDATLHVPAFLPGGAPPWMVHLLHGEPVHTTAFAQDRLFGFSTSALDAWLEEKSAGTITAHSVLRLGRDLLDRAVDEVPEGGEALLDWLLALRGNAPVVVDAECPAQLDALGALCSCRAQALSVSRRRGCDQWSGERWQDSWGNPSLQQV